MKYNKILSQFCIDGFVDKNIYQYKNCNVYDIFCDGYILFDHLLIILLYHQPQYLYHHILWD